MKIIFFTDHFVPEISAPAGHIFDRCAIWVRQGHDVTVVTNIPNYPLGKPYEGYKNRIRYWEIIKGIKVLRVGTYMSANEGTFRRIIDYLSFSISSFLNSLSLAKPDVVYSTTPHIFAPLGAIGFSILKRVPHVLEVRDIWPDSIIATTGAKSTSYLFKVSKFLEMAIYKYSKRIVVFTDSFKENLITKGVDQKKINVVINGTNLSIFKTPIFDLDLARSLNLYDKFVVGYIGTHGLSHDLMNAIRSAALVSKEGIHFLFVGEGADKVAMKRLAQELNTNNVHFVDSQIREDIPKYWGLCDVGLVHLKNSPIFRTVIPSKIFETMASGRPIVYCGPESDGSRLIKRYDCGLITNSYEPKALASRLRLLKKDPNLCQKLGMNGKKASIKFSREVQAEATLASLKLACRLSKENK